MDLSAHNAWRLHRDRSDGKSRRSDCQSGTDQKDYRDKMIHSEIAVLVKIPGERPVSIRARAGKPDPARSGTFAACWSLVAWTARSRTGD